MICSNRLVEIVNKPKPSDIEAETAHLNSHPLQISLFTDPSLLTAPVPTMPLLGMSDDHDILAFIGKLLDLALHKGDATCEALVWGLCSYEWGANAMLGIAIGYEGYADFIETSSEMLCPEAKRMGGFVDMFRGN